MDSVFTVIQKVAWMCLISNDSNESLSDNAENIVKSNLNFTFQNYP